MSRKRKIDEFFNRPAIATDNEINSVVSDISRSRSTPSEFDVAEKFDTDVSESDDRSCQATSEIVSGKKRKEKRKFQYSWLKQFTWLRYDKVNDLMTCTFCAAYPDVAGRTDFVAGSTNFKKETMSIHAQSKRHRCCRDSTLGKVSGATVSDAFRKQDRNVDEADLIIKINTAYVIAKEELPFTKFRPILELQKKNGLDISKTYANDVKCAELIGTIADVMKQAVGMKMKESNYISVMVDGATDCSVRENEAIVVRYLEGGKPVNRLLGLLELKHAHADGMYLIILIDEINFQ